MPVFGLFEEWKLIFLLLENKDLMKFKETLLKMVDSELFICKIQGFF